jgi:hypothetical protein
MDEFELPDWKRRVFALYGALRADADHRRGAAAWRTTRDRLFAEHAQSPLSPPRRAAFTGLPYFPYDPAARVRAAVEPAPRRRLEVAGSAGAVIAFVRFGLARFTLAGVRCALEIYWLDAYCGGLFVPFADATSGAASYGAGRYLLDTVKGADLGTEDGRLVLDFNLAYNPSCASDPRWACPLAPSANRLPFPVRAGERHVED